MCPKNVDTIFGSFLSQNFFLGGCGGKNEQETRVYFSHISKPYWPPKTIVQYWVMKMKMRLKMGWTGLAQVQYGHFWPPLTSGGFWGAPGVKKVIFGGKKVIFLKNTISNCLHIALKNTFWVNNNVNDEKVIGANPHQTNFSIVIFINFDSATCPLDENAMIARK